MFVNYTPDEVKAIKHKRRTLKNREYAGEDGVFFFWNFFVQLIFSAICRSRRTTQREELVGKCREYEIQIKNVKKQNALFQGVQAKVTAMLKDVELDHEPFSEGYYVAEWILKNVQCLLTTVPIYVP